MGPSDHIRRLRARVGNELLLLPSVSVLVTDDRRRLLLVRHADSGLWGLIGGAIDVDEGPAHAAVREALEETGLHVELTAMVAALGGPEFRVMYPNGDATAYVSIVYEARAIGGTLRPDGEETTEVAWFEREELGGIELGSFATASLRELGYLARPDA